MIVIQRRKASLKRRKFSIAREYQNHFLREFTKDLKIGSVLNLGATPEADDKQGALYSDYFADATFKALDTRQHDHPDYIQGDLMDADQGHGPYDLVLAMSVIEHIERPWIAAPIIAGLVAPGGYLYVAIPWLYPTHEGHDFGDHWRARPTGLCFLFESLTQIRSDFYPSSIIAIKDRPRYWKEANAAASGCSVLFQKAA